MLKLTFFIDVILDFQYLELLLTNEIHFPFKMISTNQLSQLYFSNSLNN